MSDVTAGKWTIFEPSVIRDAFSGRLGFNEAFGTVYISGATEALVLNQNPLDGSETQGDATLYAGTTNGGLYKLDYDYSSDSWSLQWQWLSEPGGAAGGFQGNQGIGALAISPDGRMIAVGIGNPSNYKHYTPNGIGLQFGNIEPDGSINWFEPPSSELLAGTPEQWNIRDMVWRGDGLYVSIAGGATASSASNYNSKVLQLDIDSAGQFVSAPQEVHTTRLTMPLAGNLTGDNAVYFGSTLEGVFAIDNDGVASKLSSATIGWDALFASRQKSSEAISRIVSAPDPATDDGRILLVGWYKYSDGNLVNGSISHVDRLSLDAQNTITAIQSLDFSGLAGSGQATNVPSYGNYALAFDTQDPTLQTVYVGGNQYTSSHPSGAKPYASNGGLIRGHFESNEIEAVFGPYQNQNAALVAESVVIGAPHADSRSIIYLQTIDGERAIQSDDGGIWQLIPRPDKENALQWESLNRGGLHSLETVSSGWDARSNSLIQAFQDNAISIAQESDPYLQNIWMGDGSLVLVDGALPESPETGVWSYLNSQKYMLRGNVTGLALGHNGTIDQIEQLTLKTNMDGSSVQPVTLWEEYALLSAGQSFDKDAPFNFPALVNPYRAGDIVLAGSSGLYETFVPNWSEYAQAQDAGTLGLLPVLPFNTANRYVTSISLGTDDTATGTPVIPKPFFWDAMVATTWDATQKQSTIWYRDATTLDVAPASLADVDKAFLKEIALKPIVNNPRQISDTAIQTSADGKVQTLYWIEANASLRYISVPSSNMPLYPNQSDAGAALVIARGENITRLSYASTPGLNQLVREGDQYGPTSIEYLPARDGFAAQLVVGGEHGLYVSELDTNGIPTGFSAMSIQGLPDQSQYGSAIMELTYSADDDVLIASVLGGGSFLYSRSGEIGQTPTGLDHLQVSQTSVPQNAAETVDKRGNPVLGNFAIELPDSAFNEQGEANIRFVIPDAQLWRTYLAGASLYSTVQQPFNLIDNDLAVIEERFTFHDFATLRIGSFETKSNAQVLPTISLPYRIELLDENGNAIDIVDASIDLTPNGSTPSFSVFSQPFLPEDREVFQAQYGFGDGVNFKKLPFAIKAALPGGLAENTEVFAFQVDGLSGQIIVDGQVLMPTSEGYLQAAKARALESSDPLVATYRGAGAGLLLPDLYSMFFADSLSDYLETEGQYFGTTLTVAMPQLYGAGSATEVPIIGIALESPDGEVKVTTADATELTANVVNLYPDQANQGVVLDVGYGGIFASQQSSGEILVSKLGQMDSAAGFFRVDDLFGTIDGINPGESGYAEAALARSLSENLDLTLEQSFGTVSNYDLDGFIAGCYYASYITRYTSTAQDALTRLLNSEAAPSDFVLFSFDAANPGTTAMGQSAAIPFAIDMIAFEDMPYRGDMDFNDVVMYYGGLV